MARTKEILATQATRRLDLPKVAVQATRRLDLQGVAIAQAVMPARKVLKSVGTTNRGTTLLEYAKEAIAANSFMRMLLNLGARRRLNLKPKPMQTLHPASCLP